MVAFVGASEAVPMAVGTSLCGDYWTSVAVCGEVGAGADAGYDEVRGGCAMQFAPSSSSVASSWLDESGAHVGRMRVLVADSQSIGTAVAVWDSTSFAAATATAAGRRCSGADGDHAGLVMGLMPVRLTGLHGIA